MVIISILVLVLLVSSVYAILRKYGGNSFGDAPETLAASVPVAFLLFASTASVLMIILPTLIAGIFAVCMICIVGFISAVKAGRARLFAFERIRDINHDQLLRLFLTVIFSVFLFALIIPTLSELSDGSLRISHGAMVDTPYHLSQVTNIGFTEKWDFEEPNFSGEFIKYPYFINLISGFLLKLGSPLVFAFQAPVILLVISALFLLISFFQNFRIGKVLVLSAVLVTLFGSGLGYIGYFLSGLPLPHRHSMPFPIQNVAYASMIPSFLIVQRAFILGFPLFLVCMKVFLSGLKSGSLRSFIWAGALIGLLPLAHTHSFIASSLIVSVLLLYLFVARDKNFFNAFRGFVFCAIPLAMPSMGSLLLMPKYLLGSALSFRLGWMTETLPNNAGLNLPYPEANKFLPWLRYMGTNFGPLVLMPVVLAVLFKKFRNNIEFVFAASGALVLWIAPNIFQFQMWDFDTNKFFAYAILFSVAALSIAIRELRRYKILATFILVVTVLFSVPSGLISSFNILIHKNEGGFVMMDKEQKDMADWIRNNTEDDDVILSSAAVFDTASIQNPVVVGAGRKTTMGFSTWLYTHGIDFSDRSDNIKLFLNDPSGNKEALYSFPADYMLIDDILRKNYPNLEEQIRSGGWESVHNNSVFDLIRLK